MCLPAPAAPVKARGVPDAYWAVRRCQTLVYRGGIILAAIIGWLKSHET